MSSRHFPNECAHPGAEFAASVAEAAARQGRFWEVHGWLYDSESADHAGTIARLCALAAPRHGPVRVDPLARAVVIDMLNRYASAKGNLTEFGLSLGVLDQKLL
jgi:hypothetical protein